MSPEPVIDGLQECLLAPRGLAARRPRLLAAAQVRRAGAFRRRAGGRGGPVTPVGFFRPGGAPAEDLDAPLALAAQGFQGLLEQFLAPLHERADGVRRG